MHKRTEGVKDARHDLLLHHSWRRGALITYAVMWVCILFLGLSLVNVRSSVVAQGDNPPPVSTRTVTADEVNQVARQIWCPLCSGVRLDACELRACEQMKEMIALKLAAGEDTDSIIAYFVEQYGPQVLGEPPREGFNWLAWILPVVAVVVGGYFFWRTTQRMVRSGADDELDVVPLAQVPNRQVITVAVPKEEGTMSEEEEYTQKLEEELAKYG